MDPDTPGHVRAQHWLAIAEETFAPADSGGRVESLNQLRAAHAAGIALHVLVPGVDDTELDAHRAALPGVPMTAIPRRTGPMSHLSTAPYLFASRPLPAGLAASLRGEGFTAVLAVSFRVTHLAVALAGELGVPAVVRPHNIESAYFAQLARSSRFPRNLPYAAEAWKLRRAEAAVHADPRIAVFAEIAEEEAATRAGLTSTPVIHVPPFLPPQDGAQRVHRTGPGGTVLFLGALDNANNSGGIGWFAEHCWPGLRAPGTDLHVVGRRAPAALVAELEAAGARVTVDAPEVASHLAAADVFVNPVRHGAGINIKMIEAMAAGLPVVSTPVGARGLHWRDGEHLLVADGPAAFTAAVRALLEDPARRAAVADAGRRFVTAELDGVAQIRRLVGALPPLPVH
ncbi:glycosyltransferase family 4 protein [Pseudonocardia abyssalis]|uniref:Glycosyltransferase n=1 Tax=Pseudonocardia abyssalis TaxID=2792008 RepID=A0ABS6UTX1_9PSEU|nr:glycosyltransferase family 4 protein [Pseudonocardia abyssalis]MBW0116080.1 glycosyltransferase [Pseudonocardia abyssalis]MBW0135713.1 glycosyltransferase [Pseudonocardia abyssalis]